MISFLKLNEKINKKSLNVSSNKDYEFIVIGSGPGGSITASEIIKYSINIKDIDAIVFYENPRLKFDRIIKNILTSLPRGFLLHFKTLNSWLAQKLFYKKK